MSGASSEAPLGRVDRVDLRHFRGWACEHQVRLGADVILLTAPNGRGKSSLIEALSRVLNGAGLHDESANASIGTEGGYQVTLSIGDRQLRHDDKDWLERLDPRRADVPDPDVLRRATTFIQDRLDDQFEKGSDGSRGTVLVFVAPFPPWLQAYNEALARIEQRWLSEQPREAPAQELFSARRRRDQAAADAVAAILPLLEERPPPDASPLDQLAWLASQATGRTANADNVDDWLRPLNDWLRERAHWTDAHSRKVAEAAERVVRTRDALRLHRDAWPNLPSLAGWAHGDVAFDQVTALVAGLAGRPRRWTDNTAILGWLGALPVASRAQVPLPDEVLTELASELAQVDPVRAGRYRDAVRAWTDFWNARTGERTANERELAAAEAELARLESDRFAAEATAMLDRFRESHSALRAVEGRQEMARRQREIWARRQPLLEAVREQRAWCEALRARQLDEHVTRRLEASMDTVMQHFVVAGLEGERHLVALEIGTDRTVRPGLADGRTLDDHASTGQKAQLALAALLGANALLQRWLPHRLLLLDDVSTALDLTNLAAECALLRKFAYTKDEGRRRQIVIASHHDQLTHRLFDLLLPPGDFTLRELRIIDWTAQDGPTVLGSTIKPTGAATDESRRRLAERLGSAFSPTRSPRSQGA